MSELHHAFPSGFAFSGDGATGDGELGNRATGDGATGHAGEPIAPGQLVVTDILPADGLSFPVVPFVAHRADAGFPSPADDYVETHLDLLELVDSQSPSTFFMRVQGESMEGAQIFDGDVIVVDRAVEPASGSVVVASVDGELTVKRFLRVQKGSHMRVALLAANPAYPPIELSEGQELILWGVVQFSLKDHRVVASRRGRTAS